MLTNLITVAGGTVIDGIIGDPPRIPHPVAGFGNGIVWLEKRLNRPECSPNWQRFSGAVTVGLILVLAFGVPFLVLKIFSPIPWLFWAVNLWLMSTTIAVKGLNQAGKLIYQLLSNNDIAKARTEVGKIVGRDTESLSKEEIIRATVETIAENSVDGVIAPLFFGFLGGTPLAMVYRAINTLDSMIGYKNDRYRYFGWAAARLDDLANYLPARICAGFMFISSFILRMDGRNSICIAFRDAKKHPSPNGGWPESAVAGALRIRLGGHNSYQGVPSFRNYLGDSLKPLELEDIRRVSLILNITVMVVLFMLLGCLLIVSRPHDLIT